MLAGDLSLETGPAGLAAQLVYLEEPKQRPGQYKDALLQYPASCAADKLYAAFEACLALLDALAGAQMGLVARSLAAVGRVLEAAPAYTEQPPYSDALTYSET